MEEDSSSPINFAIGEVPDAAYNLQPPSLLLKPSTTIQEISTRAQSKESDDATVSDSIRRLENRADAYESKMEMMMNMMADIKLQLERQAATSPSSHAPDYHVRSPSPHMNPTTPQYNGPTELYKPPKVHLEQFDGSNPLDWVFNAERFFTVQNVPVDQRLHYCSFYMQGTALSWYKWMQWNNLFSSWQMFLRDLSVRFGPSSYMNHQAALFKLRQVGMVTSYQDQFERLNNCVTGLSETAILNCFISGLKVEIQRELAIQKPTSINDAIDLAKLVEDKLHDSRARTPFTRFSTTNSTAPLLPSPPLPLQAPRISPTLPIRRLTQQEMQERRAKGLRFNCDDKFEKGHKCRSPQFLSLIVEDSVESNQPIIEPIEEECPLPPPPARFLTVETPSHEFHCSITAFHGTAAPRTLRVSGQIMGKGVSVLVDSGSTHNIIQPRVAEFLNLPIMAVSTIQVKVGNGEFIQCQGVCHNISIVLQGFSFCIPLLVLPISGADVVLGVQWLETLGPVLTLYNIPQMSFSYEGQDITLTRERRLQSATPKQIQRYQQTDAIASMYALSFEPLRTTITIPTHITPTDNPALKALLQEFDMIFQQPTILPPHRPHDHHIHLLPDTKPVNVKPYRYPHYQKNIMSGEF
ncbi:hypothetical protein OROGR_024601 [Orobanche gracilis]